MCNSDIIIKMLSPDELYTKKCLNGVSVKCQANILHKVTEKHAGIK